MNTARWARKSAAGPGARRLTGINAPIAAAAQVYGYDALERLTSANLGSYMAPISYTYDNTGNRLTNTDGAGTGAAHTTTWTVVPTSNQVASWKFGTGSSVPWTLDAAGNLINDGSGLTLSYDAKNRLASTVNGTGTTLYSHNAAGQRTEKAGPLGTELYAYDETGRLLGVYDASGNVVEELVYLDGWRPVATVRGSGGAAVVYPILTDHLGTPRKVLDPATGSTVWSWDAKEAFGKQAPTGTFTFQSRFPGQRFDPETGLVANGFRVYSAAAGRYVQSDPLGLAAGWNTYVYVSAQPIQMRDSFGLDAWLEGASYDEPDLHQSINVGDPRTPETYKSFSFGSVGGIKFWEGEVYEDVSKMGQIIRYKKMTPEQDAILKKRLELMVGMPGIYGFSDTCRSWSQKQFDQIEAPEIPSVSLPQRSSIPGPYDPDNSALHLGVNAMKKTFGLTTKPSTTSTSSSGTWVVR